MVNNKYINIDLLVQVSFCIVSFSFLNIFFICINHPLHHYNVEPSTQITLAYITYMLHNYSSKKISYLRQYSIGHHYRNVRFTAFSNTATDFNLFYFNTFRIRAEQYRIFGFQYFFSEKNHFWILETKIQLLQTTIVIDWKFVLLSPTVRFLASRPATDTVRGCMSQPPVTYNRVCLFLNKHYVSFIRFVNQIKTITCFERTKRRKNTTIWSTSIRVPPN